MVPELRPTTMRKNPDYITYYKNWARLLVLGVIPVILLTYLNYNVFNGIKLPANLIEDNQIQANRRNQEADLARVLVGIVIMFISSHVLRIFLSFHEMIVSGHALDCMSAGEEGFPVWSLVEADFSELMLAVNSSANLIIYCCFNAWFRQQIMSVRTHISNRLACSSPAKDDVQVNLAFETEERQTATTTTKPALN